MPRTALFIRTHSTDAKTLDLIQAVQAVKAADVYVCANESLGPLEFGSDIKKVSVTLDSFRKMGVHCSLQYTIQHLSDFLFYFAHEERPGYDYYILVEYDVDIQNVQILDELVGLLDGHLRGAALIATHLVPRGDDWHWTSAAARRFKTTYGAFFPFVVLSAPAIEALRGQRMLELDDRNSRNLSHDADQSADADQWVFCEAFVPSALASGGGWTMHDIGVVLPGSCNGSTFNSDLPFVFEKGKIYDPTASMVHPVCPPEVALRRRIYAAWATGSLPQLIADLENGRWSVSPDLLAICLEEARAAAVTQ